MSANSEMFDVILKLIDAVSSRAVSSNTVNGSEHVIIQYAYTRTYSHVYSVNPNRIYIVCARVYEMSGRVPIRRGGGTGKRADSTGRLRACRYNTCFIAEFKTRGDEESLLVHTETHAEPRRAV